MVVPAKAGTQRRCASGETLLRLYPGKRKNGTLYVGVTSDLVKRVWQHKDGFVDGFTKQYGVKMLVWYEQHETADAAMTRAKQLKKWNRAWKVRLIEEINPYWNDLYKEITA